MDLLTQPDACYCAAARKAARVISRIYDNHLSGTGMSIPQFSILWILVRAGEITALELSNKLAMDRTTLVRALKPLQRDSLVVERRAEPKGRQLVYTISALGAVQVEQALPHWLAAQQEIETKMGRGRIGQIRQDAQDLLNTLRDTA